MTKLNDEQLDVLLRRSGDLGQDSSLPVDGANVRMVAAERRRTRRNLAVGGLVAVLAVVGLSLFRPSRSTNSPPNDERVVDRIENPVRERQELDEIAQAREQLEIIEREFEMLQQGIGTREQEMNMLYQEQSQVVDRRIHSVGSRSKAASACLALIDPASKAQLERSELIELSKLAEIYPTVEAGKTSSDLIAN